MSLIKQIENGLLVINQSRFQDLMNHFLHLKGYKFISAPGSVVAKEKTRKGIPDSFFWDDDKYVFVEYTTQEKIGSSNSFINKLKKDINNCFNESRTKISSTEIKKVILACTDRVGLQEFNSLLEQVQQTSPTTELVVYNIQNLPLEIYDFPGLAEIYLGIIITKGDVYTLHDFLEKTKRGLQPSLINPFLYREEEIKSALNHLSSSNILILSGQAGTGKSKLATIILEKLEGAGSSPIVIQSSGVPLWQDLINLLQYNKDYIILFDDANKALNNLEYLLSFIEKPRLGTIKLIITVRDYVRKDLDKLLHEKKYNEVNLQTLKDEEIKEITNSAVPEISHHPKLLERIVEIAKGNARVALMAAYSAKSDSDINYLKNPVELYSKYFEKVAFELDIFQDKRLQAIAIVSFFGVLDKQNEKIAAVLIESFKIDWNDLWEEILFLHNHELLDVYQNQVCKASDQVLSTYVFYACFINTSTAKIDYKDWVKHFLVAYPKRIKDSLIDANNTFTYTHIKSFLVQPLRDLFEEIQNNEHLLYHYFDTFWYYRETDSLVYVKKWIESLEHEKEPELFSFTFIHNDHVYPSRHFELLIRFWSHDTPYLRPSIELSLDLIFKAPSRLPEFLKFLKENLSYNRFDHSNDYNRQNTLLDILFQKTYTPYQQKIVTGIFLSIAEPLLQWEFHDHSSKGMVMHIYTFTLLKTTSLIGFRKRVLVKLFELYKDNNAKIDDILQTYIHPGPGFDLSILADEFPLFQSFVAYNFSEPNYRQCRFIKWLSKTLIKAGYMVPSEWSTFLNSEILTLAKLIKIDYSGRDGASFEEYTEKKRRELRALVKNKLPDEIKQLLLKIESLFLHKTQNEDWWIQNSAAEIFNAIADESGAKFLIALDYYLERALGFQLHYGMMIYHILQNNRVDSKKFYALLLKHDFPNKTYWRITFFQALPESIVSNYYLAEFLKTIESLDKPVSLYSFNQLNKYSHEFEKYKNKIPALKEAGHNFLTYLTQLLLTKSEKFRIAFDHHFCQECSSYFVKHISLLKQVYTYEKKSSDSYDYDGKELKAVMSLDENFLVEYLNGRMVDFQYLSFRFDSFNLDFIWESLYYNKVMEDSLEVIITKAPLFSDFEHPANVLFKKIDSTEDKKEKVFSFIEDFIAKNHDKHQHVLVILNVVTYSFPNQLLRFLKQFLLLNKDVAFLKNMWLEKNEVYSGSRVPIIQHEITLYGEILDMVKALPDMLSYADHIAYWEREIEWRKKEIFEEQKRDFSDLYN